MQHGVEVDVHRFRVARQYFQFNVGGICRFADGDFMVNVAAYDNNVSALYFLGKVNFFVTAERGELQAAAVAVHDFQVVVVVVPHIKAAIKVFFVIRFWEECSICPHFSDIHTCIIL